MKQTAIVYSRVSTTDQDNAVQLQKIEKYCISNNYEVIHPPFVEKISGMVSGKERPVMNELLTYIETNKVDNLVVYSLSRLGRTIKNVHQIYDELNEKKINLHCIQDQIRTFDEKGKPSMVGSVLVSLLAVFSAFEHDSIIERTSTGMRYNVIEKGYWNSGIILPYGYKKINKKLEIDEEEAIIIKKIFDLCEEGQGTTLITQHLNKEGIKTRYNKLFNNRNMKMKRYKKNTDDIRWSDAQVYKILKNTIYKGERNYKDVVISSPIIIDKEQFDKCQQIMTDKQLKAGRKVVHFYILENIRKICGICENNYYPTNSINDRSYKCASKIRNKSRLVKNPCSNNGIGIDKINNCVWHCVRRTEELKKHIKQSFNSTEISNKLKILEIHLSRANDELKNLNENEKYIVELLLKGISRDVYEEKLLEIIKNKEKTNKLLTVLHNQINNTLELQARQNNIDNEIVNIKRDKFLMKEYVEKIINQVKIYPVKNFDFGKRRTKGGREDNLPDKTMMISIFLKSSIIPLNYLISQRTDAIINLNEGEYDYESNNVIGLRKDILRRTKELKHITEI